MQKACITFAWFLFLFLPANALSQGMPGSAAIRYSAQISNAPPGSCDCFALQGISGDLDWRLKSVHRAASLDVAVDLGVEHTGDANGAGYGLTLSTFTAGPRAELPGYKRVHPFVQALFGLAHGSGSQFPQNGTLVSSANSFAVEAGGGADYRLSGMFSVRLLQMDYLRTSLPNNVNDWQNNLRVGAGFVLLLR